MLTDPQVFEETHLPRRLEHRDAEVQHLSRVLEPTLRGEPAPDVLLSGPSGVGKTEGDVLREAIDALVVAAGVHRGAPVDDLVRALRDGLDTPAVLVLDEGDDLPETELLDLLDDVPNVSVVAICHNPSDWIARLDSLDSCFSGDEHLPLDRYGVTELADILQRRADAGFGNDPANREVLERIADLAAGVARNGIQALYHAAIVALEDDDARTLPEHVEPGFERARIQIREANLRSLPVHHHIVYEIVREFGPLSGRELHQEYNRVAPRAYNQTAKTPVTKSYHRGICRKLDDYDLIKRETTGGSVEYRAIDEVLKSELGVAAALVG